MAGSSVAASRSYEHISPRRDEASRARDRGDGVKADESTHTATSPFNVAILPNPNLSQSLFDCNDEDEVSDEVLKTRSRSSSEEEDSIVNESHALNSNSEFTEEPHSSHNSSFSSDTTSAFLTASAETIESDLLSITGEDPRPRKERASEGFGINGNTTRDSIEPTSSHSSFTGDTTASLDTSETDRTDREHSEVDEISNDQPKKINLVQNMEISKPASKEFQLDPIPILPGIKTIKNPVVVESTPSTEGEDEEDDEISGDYTGKEDSINEGPIGPRRIYETYETKENHSDVDSTPQTTEGEDSEDDEMSGDRSRDNEPIPEMEIAQPIKEEISPLPGKIKGTAESRSVVETTPQSTEGEDSEDDEMSGDQPTNDHQKQKMEIAQAQPINEELCPIVPGGIKRTTENRAVVETTPQTTEGEDSEDEEPSDDRSTEDEPIQKTEIVQAQPIEELRPVVLDGGIKATTENRSAVETTPQTTEGEDSEDEEPSGDRSTEDEPIQKTEIVQAQPIEELRPVVLDGGIKATTENRSAVETTPQTTEGEDSGDDETSGDPSTEDEPMQKTEIAQAQPINKDLRPIVPGGIKGITENRSVDETTPQSTEGEDSEDDETSGDRSTEDEPIQKTESVQTLSMNKEFCPVVSEKINGTTENRSVVGATPRPTEDKDSKDLEMSGNHKSKDEPLQYMEISEPSNKEFGIVVPKIAKANPLAVESTPKPEEMANIGNISSQNTSASDETDTTVILTKVAVSSTGEIIVDNGIPTPQPLQRRKKKHPEPLPMKMLKKTTNKPPVLSGSSSDDDDDDATRSNKSPITRPKAVRNYRKETKADREVLNEMKNPMPSTSAAIRKEFERHKLANINSILQEKNREDESVASKGARRNATKSDEEDTERTTGSSDDAVDTALGKNTPDANNKNKMITETVGVEDIAKMGGKVSVATNTTPKKEFTIKIEDSSDSASAAEDNVSDDKTAGAGGTIDTRRVTRSMKTTTGNSPTITKVISSPAFTDSKSSTTSRGRERVKLKPTVEAVVVVGTSSLVKAQQRGKSKAKRVANQPDEPQPTIKKSKVTQPKKDAEIESSSKVKKVPKAVVPEVNPTLGNAKSRGKSKARAITAMSKVDPFPTTTGSKTKSSQEIPDTPPAPLKAKARGKSKAIPEIQQQEVSQKTNGKIAPAPMIKKNIKTVVQENPVPQPNDVKAKGRGRSKVRPAHVEEPQPVAVDLKSISKPRTKKDPSPKPAVVKTNVRGKSKARPAQVAPEPVIAESSKAKPASKKIANATEATKSKTTKAVAKNTRRPHEPDIPQVNETGESNEDGVRRSKRSKKFRLGDEWI